MLNIFDKLKSPALAGLMKDQRVGGIALCL